MSTEHPADAHASSTTDMDIPAALQKGTLMLKVSEKKQKKLMFHVDSDEGHIIYESRKTRISTSSHHIVRTAAEPILSTD